MARSKSPECPNPKCAHGIMLRAYVRPAGEDGKQRVLPIGWWCPECGVFLNDYPN